MKQLYNARENIVERNQWRLNKNKPQEFAKDNPIKTKVGKFGIRAAGLGMGLHFLP